MIPSDLHTEQSYTLSLKEKATHTVDVHVQATCMLHITTQSHIAPPHMHAMAVPMHTTCAPYSRNQVLH
jgi:hypothetical protein